VVTPSQFALFFTSALCSEFDTETQTPSPLSPSPAEVCFLQAISHQSAAKCSAPVTRWPIHHRHCFGSKASLHDRPVKRLTTTGQPQAAEPSPRSCFPSKQQLLVCSSAAESTKLSCATGAELDPGTQPGFLVATGFFNREKLQKGAGRSTSTTKG